MAGSVARLLRGLGIVGNDCRRSFGARVLPAGLSQLQRSRTEGDNTGWVYLSGDSFDDPSPSKGNPYDSLPTYWTRFLDSLTALEAGQVLPRC